jgi:cbb3-type cytochrome c oxidase subunit III
LPLLDLRSLAIVLLICAGGLQVSGDPPAKLTRDDARKLKDPVPYTKRSIDRGRVLFQQNCTSCHGENGKAEGALIADATDLTTPALYRSGTTDGEIFRSTRDGAGDQMPAFQSQLASETDIWNLVNFIHSLWPESMRPALQDNAK